MDYRINDKVSALDLADLRQSVGWNRMEVELNNPKLHDFLTVACYEKSELMNKAIYYIKDKGIYMISVIYGEKELKSFYERFGFHTMLCGQMETYKQENQYER